MDMEKFTERSRGFLQAAQTIAIREENQRVMPEHLLKALMDDEQGFASNLIARAGGDAQAVRQAVDMAVSVLKGEKVDPVLVIPTTIVDRSNVDEYLDPNNTVY